MKHNVYYSTRLTLYTFGKLKPHQIDQLLRELTVFTEENIGYDKKDWWISIEQGTFKYNIENVKVPFGQVKDLGYYYAQLAYEDEDGSTLREEKFHVRKSRFGERIT